MALKTQVEIELPLTEDTKQRSFAGRASLRSWECSIQSNIETSTCMFQYEKSCYLEHITVFNFHGNLYGFVSSFVIFLVHIFSWVVDYG